MNATTENKMSNSSEKNWDSSLTAREFDNVSGNNQLKLSHLTNFLTTMIYAMVI